ncbi:hypothetical protein ScPMuIL_014718 [Solemya velum]
MVDFMPMRPTQNFRKSLALRTFIYKARKTRYNRHRRKLMLNEQYSKLARAVDGFLVYVLDPKEHNVVDFGAFKVGHQKEKLRNKEIVKMIEFLDEINFGMVVVVSKRRFINDNEALKMIYEMLKAMASSELQTDDITEFGAYNLIFVAGDADSVEESLVVTPDSDDIHRSKASLTLFDSKLKVSVWSEVGDRKTVCKNDVRFSHTDYSYPKLELLDAVFRWDIGDILVITSTDTDWKQVEMARIIECSDCNPTQRRVALEAEYVHWGEMVDGVDERAEVALLSRSILIEGEVQISCPDENKNCGVYDPPNRIQFPDDTFGGHLKVLEGFANVHIEFAEFYHMGQQTDLGRYAIHFHMAFDVGKMLYDSPAYVRGNAMHHTLSRCLTIHGTHNLTAEANVCFLTYGHSYFFEDGGEQDNILDGNIAIGTMYGDIIISDRKGPTAYWVTNPRNKLRNNVAAGGDHTGIWYIFPTSPMGPSADYDMMDEFEAMRTPISEFYNNVIHSFGLNGLFIDKFLDPVDGNIISGNLYNPVDNEGNTIRSYVTRLTAYKNFKHNAWVRGGEILIEQCSLADASIGLILLSANNGSQFVENCIILGLTENEGVPLVIRDRTPPVQGFVWHAGPIFIDGIYFNHFSDGVDINGVEYKSMAIGFKTTDSTPSSPANSIKNAYFGFDDYSNPSQGGNRVYDGQPFESDFFGDNSGDKSASFLDFDGSVSGLIRGNFVKNREFTRTSECVHRNNWNDLAFCHYEYGKLDFIIRLSSDQGKTFPVMTRDDNPEAKMTLEGVLSTEFPVILGGDFSYIAHFTSHVPREFVVRGLGVKRNFPIRFGICIGKGAIFELKKQNMVDNPRDPWVFVDTLQALEDATTSKHVYHDKNLGAIFFKFMNYNDRTSDDKYECPGDEFPGCPQVQIVLDTDYYNKQQFFDCTGEAYADGENSYRREPQGWTHDDPIEDDRVIPASSNGYPKGFGAGETKTANAK